LLDFTRLLLWTTQSDYVESPRIKQCVCMGSWISRGLVILTSKSFVFLTIMLDVICCGFSFSSVFETLDLPG